MIPKIEIKRMLCNVILKEERGVAAVRYKNSISKIVEYCEEYIKKTPKMPINGYDYTIPIPDSYLSDFDFLQDPKMTVYLEEYNSGDSLSGGGNTKINQFNYITLDGKLKNIRFEIYGYSYNGKLFEHTITNSIYHELNHCYDWWSRKSDKSVIEIPKDTARKYNIINGEQKFSHSSFVDDFFRQLFYRLFIPTERRALVSSVYADLKSMGSKRMDFYKDVMSTQAGYLLNKFSISLDLSIENCSVEVLENCCKALNINKISYKDASEFLSSFKNRVMEEIRSTWKNIGRAASLWYDEQEEYEMLKEDIISIDGPWTETKIGDLKK